MESPLMSRSVLFVGLCGGAAAVALTFNFATARFPFTELRCGTGPVEIKTSNPHWVVVTEQYSCGVSSDWTEVRARNLMTGVSLKLMSFDDIEEFATRQNPGGFELVASDLANVACYRSEVDGLRVTYSFDPKAPGSRPRQQSPCLSAQ
jgi:hypothetical protein